MLSQRPDQVAMGLGRRGDTKNESHLATRLQRAEGFPTECWVTRTRKFDSKESESIQTELIGLVEDRKVVIGTISESRLDTLVDGSTESNEYVRFTCSDTAKHQVLAMVTERRVCTRQLDMSVRTHAHERNSKHILYPGANVGGVRCRVINWD
ncbi:hypothetical protein BDN72DRAFT_860785 [Pluteus cervinus]|uniref:Uncharacterized protein n=1 Tax=Pluteus cervinus TaxID=181527 RepID=A0ACD3AHU4_9AGAR|nr:hypothetical protein BDN72DRAFT_860785 [Pluteus cervinus]